MPIPVASNIYQHLLLITGIINIVDTLIFVGNIADTFCRQLHQTRVTCSSTGDALYVYHLVQVPNSGDIPIRQLQHMHTAKRNGISTTYTKERQGEILSYFTMGMFYSSLRRSCCNDIHMFEASFLAICGHLAIIIPHVVQSTNATVAQKCTRFSPQPNPDSDSLT